MKIEQEHKINIMRDSVIQEMHTNDLLVGDIVILTIGNLVPADGVLVEVHDMKVDESNITGESDLVKKNSEDLILFSGLRF